MQSSFADSRACILLFFPLGFIFQIRFPEWKGLALRGSGGVNLTAISIHDAVSIITFQQADAATNNPQVESGKNILRNAQK